MAPPRGHFILRSSVLPPVTAGDYELVSEQTGTPFDVDTSRTNITVSSPRYTMPPDQILSSFPPANAEGAFGDRLPQIVLKRRTLPWERNPFGAVEVTSTPWLALVVVAEGEAELSREPRPVAECVTPGTVLRDPQDRDVEQGYCLSVTETVVAKIFPCQEDLALLTHVREVDVGDTELANGDDDGFLAVVLANRLPVFDAATGTPVRYQACLVNLEGQLDELPPPSPPEPDFRFELAQDWSILATVTEDPDVWVSGGAIGIELADVGLDLDAGAAAGRRINVVQRCQALRRCRARWRQRDVRHGAPRRARGACRPRRTQRPPWPRRPPILTPPRLVRDTMKLGFHYPISIYAVERVLRFPVLAHWSFTTNEGATFETLMQDLDVGLLGTLPTPPVPEPGQPEPPPVPQQSTVIATGHLSLGHRTRRGDTSQAWYRGPCVPHPADRELPVDGEAQRGAQRRPPPRGRARRAGGPQLLGGVRDRPAARPVAAVGHCRPAPLPAGAVRRRPPAPDRRRRAAVDDRRRWRTRPPPSRVDVLRRPDLAAAGGRSPGRRRPIADPGRPIEALAGLTGAKLDRFVADGMGIDLDALTKASDAVGVVAALAETEVPVGQRDTVDEATFAALRDGLSSEVLRLAEMAMPELRVRSGPLDTGPAGAHAGTPAPHRRLDRSHLLAPRRRAQRPPDALDEPAVSRPGGRRTEADR